MSTKDLGKGKTLYITPANELDKRLKDVFYVVEANSHENHNIWRDNEYSVNDYVNDAMRNKPFTQKTPRFLYEQDNSGFGLQVGDFHGEPVVVSFTFFKLNGLTILSYYPTSMTVNYKIIEEWFLEHCNPQHGGSRAHCDANNFHQCSNAVIDKTMKHEHRKKIANDILNEEAR